MGNIFKFIWDELFGSFIESVTKNAQFRICKFALSALSILRRALIFYLFLVAITIYATVSFFAFIFYSLIQYVQTHAFHFDAVLIFCLVSFIISVTVLLLIIGERFWIKITGMDKRIAELLQKK